jgi:hypothetical protein
MSRLGLLSHVAAFAPRLFQVRGSTWIVVGAGFLTVIGLLIWAAIALIGGLWGQAQTLVGVAPEAVRRSTGAVMEQVEVITPGAREKFGAFVPALKAEQVARDVSGTDVGPVARYPGLTRSYWQRNGNEITVRHEGPADYAAALDHYAKGFAALGYRQNLLSATPDAEQHEYLKGTDRIAFSLVRVPKGGVKVTTVAILP